MTEEWFGLSRLMSEEYFNILVSELSKHEVANSTSTRWWRPKVTSLVQSGCITTIGNTRDQFCSGLDWFDGHFC
jgi:hypothetical protein